MIGIQNLQRERVQLCNPPSRGTQFGYHIIQVESRGTKSFEEVKPQIEGKLKPELAKKAVDDVKAKTPITINDDYFGK